MAVICSKLAMKTPEQCVNSCQFNSMCELSNHNFCEFKVNNKERHQKDVVDVILVSLLLTLNKFDTSFLVFKLLFLEN